MSNCLVILLYEGGRVVRSPMQLSERWPCHIWQIGWGSGGLSHSSFVSPSR